MTGLRIMWRGSSFLNESPIAGQRIAGSSMVATELRGVVLGLMDFVPGSKEGAGVHREMLDHRAERERREEGEAADDEDDADQQADEQSAMRREGAGRGR